jgi:pyroglutamyl-peptidase
MRDSWILLTGFGPFPGVEKNPTAAVCEALNGHTFGGVPVQGSVFDVCFQSIQEQLAQAWGETPPGLVVLLGVAVDRHTIGVETRAVNRCQSQRPDATGFVPNEDQVLSKAHFLDYELHSTLDTQGLVRGLNRAGFPAELSTDAGRYLCNGVYFHGLVRAAQADNPANCVFLHLPQVGNVKGPGEEEAVWSLADLVKAVEVVLRTG